eukprot:3841360-Prymnesium_polylepis.1
MISLNIWCVDAVRALALCVPVWAESATQRESRAIAPFWRHHDGAAGVSRRIGASSRCIVADSRQHSVESCRDGAPCL